MRSHWLAAILLAIFAVVILTGNLLAGVIAFFGIFLITIGIATLMPAGVWIVAGLVTFWQAMKGLRK